MKTLSQQTSVLCLCFVLVGSWSPGVIGQVRTAEPQGSGLEEAVRLYQQVIALDRESRYAEAIPLAERALSIAEPILGPGHVEIGRLLNELGHLYSEMGEYTRAERLLERALAIREKTLAPEHHDTAVTLNNLAFLYVMRGNYVLAQSVLERVLTILEKIHGPDHPIVATSLNNLAKACAEQGQFVKAEELYQRALVIDEKAKGVDHPTVAIDLGNLAELYKTMANYDRSEKLYNRALGILEKALGPEHPNVAITLNNLAKMYIGKGDYVRAESLYQRALAIDEKALGRNHPDVAIILDNLANLYINKGDYVWAESFEQRALAIRENSLPSDHPGIAASLETLAKLRRHHNDFVQAELLYQRALTIREKVLGPNDLSVANALTDLGGLYIDTANYGRSEMLYRRALQIYEKVLGPDHPYVAAVINSLGLIYTAREDYEQAESYQQRMLVILTKAFGPDHPNIATSLHNMALLCYMRGDYVRARQFMSRGTELRERALALFLATGSERQKVAYLDTLSNETEGTISIHAHSPSDPDALQLALTTILRRKGRALDAMTDQMAGLRRRLDSKDQALLDQLSVTQSQLSKLVLGGAGKTNLESYKAAVRELEDEVEQIQNSISKLRAEFRVQTQPVTIEQVQRALPAGAALVEFVSYRPLDVKTGELNEARYVAYVLLYDGATFWVDLGEASSINDDLSAFLSALKCPQTVDDITDCPPVPEVKRLARRLDERVMRPVRKLLKGTQHIFVSPDSALNLLPFGALWTENDKYLIESYTLTYVTSGRDLMRPHVRDESRQPPLVVANPAFGKPNQTTSFKRSADLVKVTFDPLPGTAAEAKALAAILPGAVVLTQEQATEATLMKIRSPRLLHIATHGFFLPDQPQETTKGSRGGVRFMIGDSGARVLARAENPLLRSGLALAGANLPPRDNQHDDGILTALEVAGLDLLGTKLVVLSACDTGVGKVHNGEGIYGLRRALVLAGSESQVMSLWQVSDEATRDLMVSYYRRLLAGEGRTEALRQVQLGLLRNKRKQAHPYYWAAFIQSGDWTGLNLAR